MGRKRSKETIRKLSIANTGKKASDETKKKQSDEMKRRHSLGMYSKNGMLGKKHSDETKKKMRLAHLGKKHKTMSSKGRGNISKSHIGQVPWNKGMVGHNSGKNNPNWKGGVSRDTHSTTRPEYKKWRNAVFDRDDYTCQNKCCPHCGNIKGIYLEAHHIKHWAKNKELRYDVNNGITLYKKSHRKLYHGGKKN